MSEQHYWVRKCQECGHKQAAKEPSLPLTESYRNSKCRKCKSEALDYGDSNWIKDASGNYVRPTIEDEEE